MSETTVDSIWIEDSLNRREDADLLIAFLKARLNERGRGSGAYVVNLDTGWGSGKTFFLSRLKQQLELTGHLVSYVDAWRDDDAGEPLIAVIAGIDATLQPFLRGKTAISKAWDLALAAGGQVAALAARGLAYQGAKRLLGPALAEIAELSGSTQSEQEAQALADGAADGVKELATEYLKDRLTAYRQHRASTDAFKLRVASVIESLSSDKQSPRPMFVLIDELDRCRPTYAVEMLEQVKHLFDIDGICFIIATDGTQLGHSVRAVYGSSFDGDTYLRRFFNRTYRFLAPTADDFVNYLIASHPFDVDVFSVTPRESVSGAISGAVKSYSLSLRDIAHVFDHTLSIASVWGKRSKLELLYLLPLIITWHMGDKESFNRLSLGDTASIPPSWKVQTEFVSNDGTLHRGAVTVKSVLDELNEPFQSIDAFLERSASSGAHEWLWLRMRDELVNEHRGMLSNARSGRKTILASYPKMVMRMDQLVDKEAAP